MRTGGSVQVRHILCENGSDCRFSTWLYPRPVPAFLGRRRVGAGLPTRTLLEKCHVIEGDEWHFAIDEFDDGTLLAEIDDGDEPSDRVPKWLDVVRDVSHDETWTGGNLAR